MASLTGTKIKDTYVGLLKTSDNGALGASAKRITDGVGNNSPIYVSISGVGVGGSPTSAFDVIGESTVGNGTYGVKFSYSASNTSGVIDTANSANKLEFRISGSEKMRIDSSGNVTINSGTIKDASGNSRVYWGTDSYIDSPTGDIRFFAGSERMRITSGGYLKASNNGSYLGSTSNYHELRQTNSDYIIRMTSAAATPDGIYMAWDNDPNNSSQKLIYTTTGGTSRFFVESSGSVYNSTGTYGTISDIKAKENIVDATPKLDKLMDVRIVNYNLIGDDLKQIGVVAQELETIFPAMIDESTDFEEREVELRNENGEIVYETEQVLVSEAIAEELDADGNVITPAQEAVYETVTTDVPVMTTERVDLGTTTKSVKYSVFVPMLIKAIQELKAEVDALKGA